MEGCSCKERQTLLGFWGSLAATISIMLIPFYVSAATEKAPDRVATGTKAMVAAAHPLAVAAGLEILQAGGNAFDATAATAFTLAVVEPFGSGIGGDGIAVIHGPKLQHPIALDFRCVAPALASYDLYDYKKTKEWENSGKGPGVPGLVAGVCLMQKTYGRLSLEKVLEPAIRHAENGYPIGKAFSGVLNDIFSELEKHPDTARLYLVDGLPPEPGAILKNPELATVLKGIAKNGPDGFYKGPVAETIVAYLAKSGGVMTTKDLENYRPITKDPLKIKYRGYDIYSSPPAFGGLNTLSNLRIAEKLPLDFAKPPSDPANIHLLLETMKRTSRDSRTYNGDPAFTKVPTDLMLGDDFINRRVKSISTSETLSTEDNDPQPVYVNEVTNTTHMSVVDSEGNAVSMTQTLGHFFGSYQCPPGTGVVMNNQMSNFSSRKGGPNSLLPGKRMSSTQSPSLVLKDRELILAVGSPGQYQIIPAVTNVIINVLDYKMPLLDAVSAPRFSVRFNSDVVHMEGRFPASTYAKLAAMGHNVRKNYNDYDLFFGGVHAVHRNPATGVLTGTADPRRDGTAGGY